MKFENKCFEIDFTDVNYRNRWSGYSGQEKLFYEKAFQVIASINAEEFDKIANTHNLDIDKLVSARNRMMVPIIPEVLKLNKDYSYSVSWNAKITVFHGNNFICDIDEDIYEAVRMFDGKSDFCSVADKVKKELGIDLSIEKIKSLYHHRVLLGI